MASSRTSKKRPGAGKSKRGAGAGARKSRGRAAAKTSSRTRGTAAKSASATSKSKSESKSKSKKAAPKRGSGKRDLVKTPTGTFFAHREADGSFREMDEVGRSLAADRRQKAKTKVESGYGDRGDR